MSVTHINAPQPTAKMIKVTEDGRTIIADLPIGPDINSGKGEFDWINMGWTPWAVYSDEMHQQAQAKIRAEFAAITKAQEQAKINKAKVDAMFAEKEAKAAQAAARKAKTKSKSGAKKDVVQG